MANERNNWKDVELLYCMKLLHINYTPYIIGVWCRKYVILESIKVFNHLLCIFMTFSKGVRPKWH